MDSNISEWNKWKDKMKSSVSNVKQKYEEMQEKDDFSILRALNFNSKHMRQIFIIGLLSFFITYHFTGLYTSSVSAFDISSSVSVYNQDTYTLAYGDTNAMAQITKDILSTKISVVSQAKTIDPNPTHAIFGYDGYIAEVILPKNALGEVEGEVHVYKENTYYRNSDKLAKLYCDDKNAAIDEGVVCIYKIKVNLVDTQAPSIALSAYSITLYENDTFNPAAYVRSIYDNFNGNILDYSISGNTVGNSGNLTVGYHVVTYSAKDSSGNTSSCQMSINVIAIPKVVHTNTGDRPYAGNIVAEARNLIGSAYVWGGTGPYAFDCSGFVQYVYGRAGIYVPRTSWLQAEYGAYINPYDMSQWRPGDIITFGYGGREHAAIYAGNGTMVHAINPAYGVRETGIYPNIYSVRRP